MAVWALLAGFAVLTLVTYARLPPEELYNVSREGLAGGASRALVFLNFPGAFIAIGILAWCIDRLRGTRAASLGRGAVVLCAVAAWPGVLDVDDLDARWINAVPALGVAVAAALTPVALRRGSPAARDNLSLDALRAGLTIALALLAVPWLFAEAGFFAPDPIYADEVPPGEEIAAVHLGGHHGTYGVLLALAALALSRTLPRFRRPAVASAYYALMLAYGATIALEDFWHEQIEKRGAVEWTFPSLLQPELEWGWLGLLLGAALIELAWFRRERRAATRRLPARRPAPPPP